MYLEHFGLKRKPFKITPDTSLFYEGNKRGAALEALKYAVESGEGIIKVVGEVGTGKTMLCRMLEVELPDNIEIVYIANPSLSPDNILHVIGYELKLEIDGNTSKLEVMHKLQNYLLARHAENKQVVAFVEEAQSMPIETLEEIRLLSNLETNEHKLLQMVLFGQPELDEKLKNKDIRQLNERITHSFYLDPFAKEDVYEYLNFRMRSVGYRGPDIFSQKIASDIEKKSKGLTRRINIIADKALLVAYSEGGHGINKKHINIAAEDSEFYSAKNWRKTRNVAVTILVIVTSVWLGTFIPGLLQKPENIGQAQEVKEEVKNAIQPGEEKIPNEAGQAIVEVAVTNVTANADTVGSMEVIKKSHNEIDLAVDAKSNGDVGANNFERGVAADRVADDVLLEQRLGYTAEWLKKVDHSNYTIQLILLDVGSQHKVERFISRAAKLLEVDKIFIYKSLINGLNFYSVLYGEFEGRRSALDVLESIPDELLKNDPYLRNVRDIRSEYSKLDDEINLMTIKS